MRAVPCCSEPDNDEPEEELTQRAQLTHRTCMTLRTLLNGYHYVQNAKASKTPASHHVAASNQVASVDSQQVAASDVLDLAQRCMGLLLSGCLGVYFDSAVTVSHVFAQV